MPTGTPLIRIANISENKIDLSSCVYIQEKVDDRFTISYGDLLIAMSGATTGKLGVYLHKDKALLNQRVGNLKIINLDSLLPEYRNYFMQSKVNEILKRAYGGAQPNISSSNICDIDFLLPPLKEQHRIVEKVKYWFALIDIIESGKDDLQETIKQAKSKILDLAIHGKLVPQDPSDEPATELLKRFNPKAEIACDNPQYGNLPKGWCICRLKDMAKVITGSTPSKSNKEYYGGNFPFYKPADLDLGRHVNKASEYLTQAGKNVSRLVPSGTTAVCCIGSIGKVGFLEYEGTTNQQINCVIPSECLDNVYLYYSCSSQWFYSSLIAESSAVTISIVNKSKMENVVMPLPPLQEQHRIVAKIEELFTQLDKIEASL